MRRRMLIVLALAVGVTGPLAACSGDESSGDETTTTTKAPLEIVDGDTGGGGGGGGGSTTTTAKGGSTTTTAKGGLPEGGDPEQFCADWEAYEAEFAGATVYEPSMVTAIRSLRPSVPEELKDDLDLLAEVYAGLVGMTLDEVANDPATNAEVYSAGVVESLEAMQTWADTVCDR